MGDLPVVVYRVPVPTGGPEFVEVYGVPDMAWYEWRLVLGVKVVFDSRDMGYGIPEAALRDALVSTS